VLALPWCLHPEMPRVLIPVAAEGRVTHQELHLGGSLEPQAAQLLRLLLRQLEDGMRPSSSLGDKRKGSALLTAQKRLRVSEAHDSDDNDDSDDSIEPSDSDNDGMSLGESEDSAGESSDKDSDAAEGPRMLRTNTVDGVEPGSERGTYEGDEDNASKVAEGDSASGTRVNAVADDHQSFSPACTTNGDGSEAAKAVNEGGDSAVAASEAQSAAIVQHEATNPVLFSTQIEGPLVSPSVRHPALHDAGLIIHHLVH